MKTDISIVIEWENVLLAEDDRCFKMLEHLHQQACELSKSIEIIVLFNPEQFTAELVNSEVERYLGVAEASDCHVQVRVEAATGLHYYQLKNHGADLAQGDILVFMDSDVIPEDGWLAAISMPFYEHPEIEVLSGHTYLDPSDLVSRAFALGWFFPLRGHSEKMAKGVSYFYANNVAFRRNTFMRYKFPEMPEGMTRGACGILANTLKLDGIEIWKNHNAQASHPAPNGLSHFINRGFAEGRDWAMQRQASGKKALTTNFHIIEKSIKKTVRMVKKTVRNGRGVGLRMWQSPIAILIMAVYYLEICLGAWIYSVMPNFARKSWRV